MKKNPKSPILQGLAMALALTSATWSAHANVYATNIKINGSTNSPTVFAGNSVAISYILNEPASGVTVNILSGITVVRSISVTAGNQGTRRGANTVTWDGKNSAGNPVAGEDFSCSTPRGPLATRCGRKPPRTAIRVIRFGNRGGWQSIRIPTAS